MLQGGRAENEKLRQALVEAQHRTCLLEFGIGMIAKVVQSGAGPELLDGKCKNPVIEGIHKVLQDVQDCFRAATDSSTNPGEEEPYDGSVTFGGMPGPTPSPTEKLDHFPGNKVKRRIFIDETLSGEHNVRNECHIVEAVVGNPIPCSIEDKRLLLKSGYSDPALDALSTLAEVATEKAQEKELARNWTKGAVQGFVKNKSPKQGYLQGKRTQGFEETVPFKKRRMGNSIMAVPVTASQKRQKQHPF